MNPEQAKSKDSRRSVTGLNASVSIRRDGYGIPHVEAETEHDAWVGTGYACGQDRMWQLEWYRLRGQGRWAEVVGEPGIEVDTFFRNIELAAASKAEVTGMSEETRAMFEAYAEGVNAFLNSGEALPEEYSLTGIEPEPWEPWHSVLLFKVRHAIMGKWQLKLVRTEMVQRIGAEKYRMIEGLRPEGQRILDPPGGTSAGQESPFMESIESLDRLTSRFAGWEADDGGSNSWAVHGSRVTTGKPVICNDSHRPLDVPNVYWQVHVSCPGFNAAGGAFPGFPGFPHFGHSEHASWAITHGMGDNQDLYLEKFNKEDPSLYQTEEGWKKADMKTGVINVRGGEPVEIELRRTRHGNIIQGKPAEGWGLALAYTAIDRPSRQWECLRLMLTAKTVRDLIESQREWVEPVNNFLCADTKGSIGYLTRGRVPVRSTRDGRQFVVPGWIGEHKWTGDVPFEEMPRIIDPPKGYILTANQRIRNGENPYIAYEFSQPGRAERINERLKGEGLMSPDEIASIQSDTVSVQARGWSALIAKLPESPQLDSAAVKAKNLLAGWDGDLLPDSPQALLFGLFRLALAEEVFKPILGEQTWQWMITGANTGAETLLSGWLYNLMDRTIKLGPEEPAPDGRSWNQLLPSLLSTAWCRAVDIAGTADPDTWSWGEHHRTCAEHTLAGAFPDHAEKLNPPSVPMGGDNDTIQVSGYRFDSGVAKAVDSPEGAASKNVFPVQGLSVYRQVVDLSDVQLARWVIPAGSSGKSGTPHFADQLPEWHAHRLVPMYFSSQQVKENAVSRLELYPG